jgi:hypothetical protein
VLKQAGVPVTGKQLLLALAGRYALLVLGAAVQALLRLRHGDLDRARSAGLRLALLLALPLIAWPSVNSMQHAWP